MQSVIEKCALDLPSVRPQLHESKLAVSLMIAEMQSQSAGSGLAEVLKSIAEKAEFGLSDIHRLREPLDVYLSQFDDGGEDHKHEFEGNINMVLDKMLAAAALQTDVQSAHSFSEVMTDLLKMTSSTRPSVSAYLNVVKAWRSVQESVSQWESSGATVPERMQKDVGDKLVKTLLQAVAVAESGALRECPAQFEHTAGASLQSAKLLIDAAASERLQAQEALMDQRRESLQSVPGIGAFGREWAGDFTISAMSYDESIELAKDTLMTVSDEELKNNIREFDSALQQTSNVYEIFGKQRDPSAQSKDKALLANSLGAKFTALFATILKDITTKTIPQRSKRILRNIRHDLMNSATDASACVPQVLLAKVSDLAPK